MKRFTSAPAFMGGLVTLVLLGGSLPLTLAFILRMGLSMNPNLAVLIGLGLNVLTGAAWAVGMTRVLPHTGDRVYILGGIRWAGGMFAGMMLLGGVNQLAHYLYDWRNPYNPVVVEWMFALSFTLVIGLVALANARGLLEQLNLRELKRAAGARAGLAAGLVFAAGVLVLHVLGWQVGSGAAVAFKMSKVVSVSGALAAFAAGYVLVWQVVSQRGPSEEEVV